MDGSLRLTRPFARLNQPGKIQVNNVTNDNNNNFKKGGGKTGNKSQAPGGAEPRLSRAPSFPRSSRASCSRFSRLRPSMLSLSTVPRPCRTAAAPASSAPNRRDGREKLSHAWGMGRPRKLRGFRVFRGGRKAERRLHQASRR